jgi:hypothetical protein
LHQVKETMIKCRIMLQILTLDDQDRAIDVRGGESSLKGFNDRFGIFPCVAGGCIEIGEKQQPILWQSKSCPLYFCGWRDTNRWRKQVYRDGRRIRENRLNKAAGCL